MGLAVPEPESALGLDVELQLATREAGSGMVAFVLPLNKYAKKLNCLARWMRNVRVIEGS